MKVSIEVEDCSLLMACLVMSFPGMVVEHWPCLLCDHLSVPCFSSALPFVLVSSGQEL